jgi:cytochrome c
MRTVKRSGPSVGRRARGIGLAMGLTTMMLTACAPAPAPRPPSAGSTSASAVSIDATMEPLLVRSCYPCHSAERRDPWYAKIAPSSWSTTGARGVLDFSAWPTYDAAHRASAVEMIADAVERGTMPPADYTFFNHQARLDPGDRSAVEAWAAAQRR